MTSRLLAAAAFLHPAGRPDVCLALREADASGVRPPWIVQRVFVCLSLWPLLVECHALALDRARFDPAFNAELLDTLAEVFGLPGIEDDPFPPIAALAGEMLGFAWHVADLGYAPYPMVTQCVARFGQVYGQKGWMRVDWHDVDPDQTLPLAGRKEMRRVSKRLLANADIPGAADELASTVARALVDLVAIKRMRDAA
ncbi:hypothetical protein [Aureimonas sp. SK2]|uniref:hypothetical protein n=1 Tax=Aureimonas sp. SK2 TaxID=3015992 RepID=UPI0024439C14|nr:hypothetical protein [Aureimonas sp. SK2]